MWLKKVCYTLTEVGIGQHLGELDDVGFFRHNSELATYIAHTHTEDLAEAIKKCATDMRQVDNKEMLVVQAVCAELKIGWWHNTGEEFFTIVVQIHPDRPAVIHRLIDFGWQRVSKEEVNWQ